MLLVHLLYNTYPITLTYDIVHHSSVYSITFSSFVFTDGLLNEGEFLEIKEIKRHQAEEFECITNNGVAPPDTRRVKVTVNCKSSRREQRIHILMRSLRLFQNTL